MVGKRCPGRNTSLASCSRVFVITNGLNTWQRVHDLVTVSDYLYSKQHWRTLPSLDNSGPDTRMREIISNRESSSAVLLLD